MTREEIEPISKVVIYDNEKHEIIFKDGNSVFGFFNGGRHESLKEQNKWSFVVTPQPNGEKKQTIFNGDDFKSIVFHINQP